MARKRLEEMSLIDDFLMNEVIGDKEHGGKVIGYFLQVILGKKIEINDVQIQSIATSSDPGRRGIRLDIRTRISLDETLMTYDISAANNILNKQNATVNFEMQNRRSETGPGQRYDIRRRSRFHQGMIDGKMLPSGSGFGDLDDVLIIICTSFDIFGLGLRKYTFTNTCLEDRTLALEDGAFRIYLNTNGKWGGSDELKDLLIYTADSDITNVTNQNLNDLHEIVSKVKKSKEARERYMFEWEKRERIHDEYREELAEKDAVLDAALAEKDDAIAEKDAALTRIAELEAQLAKEKVKE